MRRQAAATKAAASRTHSKASSPDGDEAITKFLYGISLNRTSQQVFNSLGREASNHMKKCHVCGSTESHREHVDELLTIKGRRLLVEKIPARPRNAYANWSTVLANKLEKHPWIASRFPEKPSLCVFVPLLFD